MDTIIEERNKLQSQMEEYQSLVHAVEKNLEIDKNIMKKPDSLKEFCNKISKIQGKTVFKVLFGDILEFHNTCPRT